MSGAKKMRFFSDRDSPQHSQWLQKTLSDMNERMQTMMTLLEEDGNSPDRVASHSKRRLELVQMLEEFNRSYRYLAETYDRLRSKFLVKDSRPAPLYTAIDSNKETPIESSDNSNLEISDSYPQFVVEDPEIKCDSANFDVEYLDKLVDELMLTEECKMKLKEKREIGENQMDKRGRDIFPSRKFQITNLMEENLQQQTELARRNIEKKLVIDKLRLQLEHVKAENRSLQNCISCLKVGEKRKSLQIRGLLSGKFFGGGCT
ncbi:PROTEIN NETWORKED 4A [Salix koriyanagi]|uniref:PROTEIN NETWORKED 4A n=1 Tax=Salix koriyanagi TaxID=2511006 RepID=A0A9Q1AN18_9ROSI|nr:PROTEIN NETWORKED 4A [Salix koriyanagi]